MKLKRRKDINRPFMYGIMIMALIVIVLVLLFVEWAFQQPVVTP